MPSLGHIAGSLAATLAVTLLFLLWIGWPGFLAVGAGAVLGVAFLVVATSLGVDPRAADEAWRSHAVDLIGAPGGADGDGARGGLGEDHGTAGSPTTTSAADGAGGDAVDGTPAP